MGVSDTSYDGFDDQTGIYKNPLFGVKNQSYDAAKEETNVWLFIEENCSIQIEISQQFWTYVPYFFD